MEKRQRVIILVLAVVFVLLVVYLAAVRKGVWFARERSVLAYFLSYDESRQKNYLVPVRRRIERAKGQEDKIKAAVEQLLKGLTEEEKGAGLTSAVAEDASLLEVRIEDDTTYLDFSKEIEQGGGTSMMMDRLGQIVFTATQFYPVSKVRILINGKFIKYFSGEGITDVENPMGRDNFSYLVR